VDPLDAVCATARDAGAWVHVDGAFGLWAAAAPSLRHLVAGVERADSWATDGHKWLNVPYDCGIALVADAAQQRGAMASIAEYIPPNESAIAWSLEVTPEFSRRARATPLYAALRSLGRDGLTDLVDRCCDHAQRIAARLDQDDDVEILNDVVLNQVLVRFGASDEVTDRVIERVLQDGTCWAGADRSAAAILAALRAVTPAA
jgi:glutamate/tyrosine decarboxylase-like PLP-dependent enzyme